MRTQTLLVVIALVLINIEDSLTRNHKMVMCHYIYVLVAVIVNLVFAILELVKA